ncbi:hypothetical protein RYH80_05595 [Halobaculum sp. MBLA0147]|uniref:DUF7311 family protein n=1 Tax=Halobaculum sp. MBLA0147 TaxID=3079934 RepID=UPI0035268A0E
MIRLVVAVALAVGLLALAAPAVERATVQRTTGALDRGATALASASDELTATAPPVPLATPGARRLVEVRLPSPGPTAAPVHHLRLRCHGPKRLQFVGSVGGRRHTTSVAIDWPVALVTGASGRIGATGPTGSERDPERGGLGLENDASGDTAVDTTLAVGLHRVAGRPTVVVGRASGGHVRGDGRAARRAGSENGVDGGERRRSSSTETEPPTVCSTTASGVSRRSTT